MDEILELTDRVTIMRDGSVITTLQTRDTNRAEIIKNMIGRESSMNFPAKKQFSGEKITYLGVRNLKNKALKDISFDLESGEILGVAGLVGAGRTETVRAIFGADTLESGELFLKGEKVTIKKPADAIERGIALIPEDRKRQGLHLELPIRQNMTLIELKALSKSLFVSKKKENELIDKYIKLLSIKLASPELTASSLSGGNQQKLVLTKWLATNADVLIFDEPTRGIDVGAKSEIYDLMNDLREQGKGIIMISSELPEVIGMCDRVIVMHEGKIAGELSSEELSEVNVMELATGG
jgi:ribose transport system ATP-binding protein